MRRIQFSRSTAWVLGLMAVFLAAVVLAATSLVWSARQTALAEGETGATRFISGAEAAVNRSLLGIDVMLASMDDLLGLSALTAEWIDPKTASQLMRATVRQNLMVRNVALINAKGHIVASSDPLGVELELNLPAGFLDEVLAQPVSSLNVSAPAVSFASSEQVIYLARHIKLTDGSRVLAVAEVQIPVLMNILIQGVEIAGLEVALERGDGRVLASVPTREGRPAGADAIVVTRPVLARDLRISASIPIATALHDWTRQSAVVVAVALVFALLLLAAGGFSIWYLSRLTQARRAIVQSKATLDQALEAMVSGFMLLDSEHRVLRWNRRFEEIFPWLAGSMSHLMPFRRVLEVTVKHHLPAASEAEQRNWVERRLALQWQQKDPHEQTLPNGRFIQITERPTPEGGLVIVYHDVTDLHLASAEIENLAFFDPLTHLPNRRLLMDRLEQALASSARSGREAALLFIDLDHFKTLNDTLGHDIGDLLLQQVAQRLSACVREGDTVARLGGDEFVVMLADLSALPVGAGAHAKAVAQKILESLNQPYRLASHEYRSTPSIGVTLFSGHNASIDELLKHADIAMYQAKRAGRNAVRMFDPAMQEAITARAAMELDLRKALLEREFVLYYQPQVDAAGHVIGGEALLRWRHPERGLVSPAEFIPLAEETGLILALGQWVLESACTQLAAWASQSETAHLSLAVNVSGHQFNLPDFVQQVLDVIERTGVAPTQLKLELTESLLLENAEDIIEKMLALKGHGVSFSLDDFGTGYSSLSYLKRLPLDQLKIDRSFVRDILIDPNDAAIARTVVALGQSLGLAVIAEGVETEAQRGFLAANGCLTYQGYLFSPPLPAPEFEAFVRAHGQHES